MRQKTVKIFNEKLNFREKAESKIKSFENFNYHNKETNVEVFNDRLPWIRQNKSQPPEDSKNKTGTKSGVDSQNKNEGKENLQMRVRNINEDKSKSKQNVFSDSSSKVNKIDSNQKNINYTSNHSLNQNQGQKRDNNNNNKIYYNSSNNDYLNSKNQSSKSKEYGKQDRDTSTETDKVRKIFHERLYFRYNAEPKIRSLENIHYQPKDSDIEIFKDHLPWLYYNKPNLSVEVKKEIEKKIYNNQDRNTFSRVKKIIYDPQKDGGITNRSSPKPILSKVDTFIVSRPKPKQRTNNSKSLTDTNHNLVSNKSGHRKSNGYTFNSEHNMPKQTDRKKPTNVSIKAYKIQNATIGIQTNLPLRSDPKSSKISKSNETVRVSERYLEKDNKILLSKNSGTESSNFVKNSRLETNHRREVIKKNITDNILTTKSFADKEIQTRPQYHNNFPLVDESDSYGANKYSVTHVSQDYLDQYWADKRKNMIHKEKYYGTDDLISQDTKYSIPQRESQFNHFESYSDYFSYPELFNKKENPYQKNMNKSHDRINKIRGRDLGKIFD